MVTPFGGGDPRPLFPGLPDMWMSGLSLVGDSVAAGFSDDDGYTIVVRHGSEPTREIYRNGQPAGAGQDWPQGPGGLSADASLVAIWHTEGSNIENPAVRVLDAHTGDPVAGVADDAMAVVAAGWSPVPGDDRLVLLREIGGFSRPFLWAPRMGAPKEIALDVPGTVTLADWYPTGDALLTAITRRRTASCGSGRTAAAHHGRRGGRHDQPRRVRPDGHVWFRHEDGVRPPTWREAPSGVEVLRIAEPPLRGVRGSRCGSTTRSASPSRRCSCDRTGAAVPRRRVGARRPELPRHRCLRTPAPSLRRRRLRRHARELPRFDRLRAPQFRQALYGDIGFPESEDINAGLDHAIEAGLVEPERVFLEGWSWGGYLATLNAGLHPERWRA